MLRRIEVKQFMGFDSFRADLSPVSVCVGPNNSGKTALLSAISFACLTLRAALEEGYLFQLPRDLEGPECFRVTSARQLTTQAMPWLRIDDPADLHFNREDNSVDIALMFDETDAIKGFEISIDDSDNITTIVRSPQAAMTKEKLEPRSKGWESACRRLLHDAAPMPVFVPPFSGAILQEEYRTSAAVDRMIASGRQNQVIRNLVARLNRRQFNVLKSIVQELTGQHLHGVTSSKERDAVEFLELLFRTPKAILELVSMGAGVGSIVALVATILLHSHSRGSRPAILLVDEPEVHLHPKLQASTALRLATLARDVGVQLILSTHSVEVINRMSGIADTTVITIDRHTTSAVALSSEEGILAELARWCNLTPFSSIGFLKSRKILLHEGPSDAEILVRCAEVYFHNQPHRLDKFRTWVLQPMLGTGNAKIADLLPRVLAPMLHAEGSPRPFRVVRVLDRDHHRAAAMTVLKADERVKLVEVVWSRHSIESLFLDETFLSAWLHPQVARIHDISAATFAAIVADALREADCNEELLGEARNQLMLAIAGKNRDDTSIVRAARAAEKEVLERPRVWQHGRNRAHEVLAGIRRRLPVSIQNRIRGDLAQVLSAGFSMVDTKVPDLLVPPEIVQLLEHLTDD